MKQILVRAMRSLLVFLLMKSFSVYVYAAPRPPRTGQDGALGRFRPANRYCGNLRAALRQAQAVTTAAAASRPSSATATSRILNFWILPVTVIGNASTNFQ